VSESYKKGITMPIGSNFDDFLKDQGIFELCSAAAIKSVLQTGPFDATDSLIDDATVQK
jgi:hypothetical protein